MLNKCLLEIITHFSFFLCIYLFIYLFLLLRSAAYIKMGQFHKALQDAVKAKDLNPEWPKVTNIDKDKNRAVEWDIVIRECGETIGKYVKN